ncbi:alpha/beta hydrolase [Fodinibius halophilus]|uniref:Alpha/beta fold hydrolase n=1 Tax=Fodinibius halophilus TaxID=1736908 RepID=A0A6M1T602_9BACT|nr:alpha/beta hydrolase [Fodinibius halophilus]NGP88715.1 alpha/beta fold hydrolase [Fodinibius halophilus]
MTEESLSLLQSSESWIISLRNSEHIEWSDDFKTVHFNWEALDVPGNANRVQIIIAVSKHHTAKNTAQIKSIFRIIAASWQITEGAGVIGVDEQGEVDRIGTVIENTGLQNNNRETTLTIKWTEEGIGNTATILDEGINFKKLTKAKLKKLDVPTESNFSKKRRSFSKSPVEKVVKSIPPEMAFKDMDEWADEDHKEETADEASLDDSGGKVTLFYGTNRNKTGSDKWNDYYGNKLKKLKFGFCEVSIPPNHKLGEIERPFGIWKLTFPEKEDKHVIIQHLEEYNEDTYYELLAEEFEQLDNKTGLIFLPGYNNTFAQAARRAGQIAYDLPFFGLAGFFSWPSAGKTPFYGSDIEYADASIPDFERFLKKFVSQTNVKQLHLIAHSMGNRILTTTLKDLSEDSSFAHQLKKFHQIVLAAPDIDQEVFKRNILPHFKKVGKRRTIYASDKDRALAAAEWLRGKRPRLGDGGNSIFVTEEIDTIDASNINGPGFLDHSYLFETRPLLTDLNSLINNDIEPKARSLRKRDKNNLPYWLFPK